MDEFNFNKKYTELAIKWDKYIKSLPIDEREKLFKDHNRYMEEFKMFKTKIFGENIVRNY